MGTVWRAEDTLLKREVAVKEVALPPTVATQEQGAIRARVLREARAAAALNHPNAVTVFDVIEEAGKAFIVMECVAGPTLDDIVSREGPLSDERLVGLAADLLSVLESAHAAGIVHRDVKPANVMITADGRTKLADFGIASVKDDPKITASGLVLGSPSYMAPEQATQGESGPEADLWGLGATLYFALEGVPPFDRHGPLATLTAVIGDDFRPLTKNSNLIPVVEALLAKDPRDRPSPVEVRSMLDGTRTTAAATEAPPTVPLDHTTPASPTPAPPPAPAPTTRTDRKWIAWLVGAGVVLLVAVLLGMSLGRDDATTVANDPQPKTKKGAPRGSNANEPDAAADARGAEVPAAWTTYENPAVGYTIAYPADWTVEERDEHNTLFHSPDGSFLQVGWRSPPDKAGPVGAWKEYEPSFASRQGDYQRITIEPTEFKGMEAGWWEMTYEGLHAVNLGFITPDGEYGMALFFNTPESEWDESQPLFEEFQDSFDPPPQ